MNKQTPIKVILCIILLAGSTFLYLAISRTIDTINFIKTSQLTKGYIYDFETENSRDSNGDKSRNKYTKVLFVDDDGNNVRIRSSSSTSFTTDRIGDEVEVRYITGKSEEARISSFFSDMWGLTLLFGLFGIIFTAPGFILVWNLVYDIIFNIKNR
ncbi:DUF3592 domain-containing protein [Cellulophaga baltica]|uniref:DUF3592 domain-containing protein n=1 Tax=Cellulophaga TaxID=104264 RepID=UPI001C071BC8|nr:MULTISPECIES: DUF3592 domain-containing protein [Cellulophaga]MBU2997000.1 DUF3592 domain-containing protein [Cellulophaga baltica]MDO6768398.1 DUF3592 domain-containing protein [Cellulophaga sp. 1_MG-2023]